MSRNADPPGGYVSGCLGPTAAVDPRDGWPRGVIPLLDDCIGLLPPSRSRRRARAQEARAPPKNSRLKAPRCNASEEPSAVAGVDREVLLL
eukprot:5372191-Pyramimonas_sp.AAC.1